MPWIDQRLCQKCLLICNYEHNIQPLQKSQIPGSNSSSIHSLFKLFYKINLNFKCAAMRYSGFSDVSLGVSDLIMRNILNSSAARCSGAVRCKVGLMDDVILFAFGYDEDFQALLDNEQFACAQTNVLLNSLTKCDRTTFHFAFAHYI